MREKAEFYSSEYADTYFRSNNSSAMIRSLAEKTKVWDRPSLADSLVLSAPTIQAHPSEREGSKIIDKHINNFLKANHITIFLPLR